jgi:hypothetical protein
MGSSHPLCQQRRAVGLKVLLGNAFLIQARKTICGSHTRKLVYLCLCDHADDKTGICWPSVKTLCEETELSERPVRRIIGELENLKLIRVERRGDQHLVSRYWVVKQGCFQSTLRVSEEQAKGARRAVKGAPQAPQASGSHNEATKGNGEPPEFKSRLLRQIEEARSEKNRIFAAYAIEHSIDGTSWRSQEAKAKWDQWRKLEKRCLEKLPYAI